MFLRAFLRTGRGSPLKAAQRRRRIYSQGSLPHIAFLAMDAKV